MKHIAFALALGLGACASTTPVLPLGGGEYTVTAQTDYMSGGAAGAQRRVVNRAESYCVGQGKTVQAGDVQRNINQARGYYDFSLRFRCVDRASQ